MAEKIDYKEYLKQFGKIETDSKNRIKAYLEEQIKRLKVSIDREVPESGPFKDVIDLFTNTVNFFLINNFQFSFRTLTISIFNCFLNVYPVMNITTNNEEIIIFIIER